jgi:hypothetical protein
MTDAMPDGELYAILRAADPLIDEPQRSADATDALLRRLLDRRSALGNPHRRRLTVRRHLKSWWMVRSAPLAAGAAVAIAALVALPSSGPVSVPAASAKAILARATAAVMGSDGALLHADISATQTWQNGRGDYWTEQDWQQVSSPYDDRSIVTGVWPSTIEMAYVKGQVWLYDAGTNTIYTGEPTASAFTLAPGPQTGTYTLSTPSGGPSLTVTASQAAALRDGQDVLATDGRGGLLVTPRPTTGPQILSQFRSQALSLLHSPAATVSRNATVDGQAALEVTSPDRTRTYYLNPSTYAPIEMTSTIGRSNDDGDPGNESTVTLKFTDWQYLTGVAANPDLLSLSAQHPGATINNSAADYSAAQDRLFP